MSLGLMIFKNINYYFSDSLYSQALAFSQVPSRIAFNIFIYEVILTAFLSTWLYSYYYLIQNNQAVKKECGSQKGYGEKRCEIQGSSQEMAVMVG